MPYFTYAYIIIWYIKSSNTRFVVKSMFCNMSVFLHVSNKCKENAIKMQKNSKIYLDCIKKCATFASLLKNKSTEQKSSLKRFHKQYVVQEQEKQSECCLMRLKGDEPG